jgi:hypothetical protein
MAETPPGGPSYGQSASGFPGAPGQFSGAPGGPPSWPSSAPRGASRLLTFVSLGISVIATVLAIVGWFRPVHTAAPAAGPSGSPTYTEQQTANAKSDACNAFQTVKKGTTLQTNLPQTDDPAMANAQATHAQLSLLGGGLYLTATLDPATPTSLADEIRKLAKTLSDVGANAIAGAKNADPSQAARMDEANSAFERVADMCK